MADFGGWHMPIEYPGGGVVAEHTAVRERVGIFDVSHLGKASVTGPGAVDFVNACLTNDLRRIGPGKAQYTMCCDESGGVVDDLIQYVRAEDDVFLIPNAANTTEVVPTARARPRPTGSTSRTCTTHTGSSPSRDRRSDEVVRALGLPTEHDYMGFAVADWDGRPVIVCRTGYTGERGYELVPRWEDSAALWDALTEAMAPYDGLPCGLGARDTLRTEMGYPLHGQDLSLDITPVQARAGWAVGWKKPEFWGREALVAEKAAGPARQSWGLLVTGRGIPRQHCAVTVDGRPVGEVTSGTFSPTLRQGIALALLEPSVGLGDDVVVDVRGREVAATVVKPPFVQVQTRQA